MTKTTVALFDEMNEAEQTVRELVDAGFAREDISIIANRAKCGPEIGPVESVGTERGVGTGMAIGGSAGFALGLFALAIPGIGPVIAAGPLAAGLLGAGVGAASGGVIGALTRSGVSEQDAGCYCEAVRRGGIVVSVNSADQDADRAAEIIGRHRLVDIDECVAEWRESGWKGFDPNAEPAANIQEGTPREAALPFDPESIRPGRRKARRERRAVRSYVRVR